MSKEDRNEKREIKSYTDLEIYQELFSLMKEVVRDVLPKLPKEERFDLIDQLRRSCKAPCALIAEGFAKRYQIRQWRKYLDDTVGEINETINHLSVSNELYLSNDNTINELIDRYTVINKRIYRLKQTWQNFNDSQ